GLCVPDGSSPWADDFLAFTIARGWRWHPHQMASCRAGAPPGPLADPAGGHRGSAAWWGRRIRPPRDWGNGDLADWRATPAPDRRERTIRLAGVLATPGPRY